MKSEKLFFCLIPLILAHAISLDSSSKIYQDRRFISVKTGKDLTLQCFYEKENFESLFWYKQGLGQKLQLISTFTKYKDNKTTIHNEFKKSLRFSSNAKNGKNDLNIKNLHVSDSGTYYCARQFLHEFEFAEGTFVNIEKANPDFQSSVNQPETVTILVGGSASLNCTIHAGMCDGEHSVYWFKDGGESHSGLIHTHRGRNDNCEKNSITHTQSCVYNLPMENLNMSDSGIYYCAVASCGHILFGKGTSLKFTHDEDLLVPVWRAAFVFSSFLNILLAFSICIMSKSNCRKPPESEAESAGLLAAHGKGYKRAESIKDLYLSRRLGRPSDPTWSECVYRNLKL